MKKINLSANSFNSLQRDLIGPKVQRIWFSNFKGLGCDKGKTKKSIIFKYKSPVTNTFRILTIETFNNTQLLNEEHIDELVGEYYSIKSKIRAGIDPLTEKDNQRKLKKLVEIDAKESKAEAERTAKENEYTLNRAWDAYTKHRLFTAEIAQSTQDTYENTYNYHIAPVLGRIPLSDIEPFQVNNFLDKLKDSACNTSICVLMRIQKVAMRSGKITKPFIFDADRRVIGKRSRMIEDLPAFIAWLEDNQKYRSYKNAIHSQLLYGTRAVEIYGLKWSEIDYQKQVINISWERVKTRRVALKQFEPLTLPLMPGMMNILQQQKGFSDIYVFPMLSKDKSMMNNQAHLLLKNNGFNNSSHDIRRTVSTLMRIELNMSMDDINLILDHSIGSVNQSYVHGTPVERKRKIMSKWHSYMNFVCNPEAHALKAVN